MPETATSLPDVHGRSIDPRGVLRAIKNPDALRRLLEANLLLGANLDLSQLLRHIVEEACTLAGARYGALGVLDGSGSALDQFVTVGLDPDTERTLLQSPFPEGKGVLGVVITDPQPLRLVEISEHGESVGFPPGHPPMSSFLGVPIKIGNRVYGNLYLTDKECGTSFTEDDEALVSALAVAAAVAVENARLHQRAAEVAVYQERERLARDLHDGVIQRLFAIGLSIQGLSASAADANVAEALGAFVDDLDETIGQIRSSIFELGGAASGQGIRSRVLDMVDQLTDVVGSTPVVIFNGPVERVVNGASAEQLLAALREGLINVGRHASATSVEVRLSATDERCKLQVIDDGIGFDAETRRQGGTGLAILAKRAARLGGSFGIEESGSGGTGMTWQFPVLP